MKAMSIAQEYLLCALKEKGRFSFLSNEQVICFVAGALFDLLNNDFVRVKDKKVVIHRHLEASFNYLAPMLEYIRNSKPKTIKGIVEGYFFTLTKKNIKALLQSVVGSLAAIGCADEVSKTGILGNSQKYIVPKKEQTERVIQKIRAELLETGAISDETVALACLLRNSGLLKQYFSKHDSQELNKCLNELKDSVPNQMIKQIIDDVNAVFAAIIAATVMPK